MEDKIINGKEISTLIRKELRDEISLLTSQKSFQPGLAVVLVGNDEASEIYVRNKKKACQEIGIKSFEHILDASITQKELISLICSLNENPEINGILVQLPLPPHIDKDKIITAISPHKDVDGFHPENVGRLVSNNCTLTSCTPAGIVELLDRYKVKIEGMNVVIIGRSDIVGKPVALMLLHRNATITICHSKTKDIAKVIKSADIVVAAVGIARFVTDSMIKDGAVVIDVGINRENGRLVGDVDFEHVVKKASKITPVPGGVGPMTIAMLLKNTVCAYKNQQMKS